MARLSYMSVSVIELGYGGVHHVWRCVFGVRGGICLFNVQQIKQTHIENETMDSMVVPAAPAAAKAGAEEDDDDEYD